MEHRLKRITTILMLTGLANAAVAQNEHPTIKADRLYRDGKFKEALAEYQKASEEFSNDPVVNYNLGDASFRNSNYSEAEKSFDKAFVSGADTAMKQRAAYNKGVALSKQNKLEESIVAYKTAVMMNPADSNARINLQKALLEQRKKQEPEKQKNDEKKNQKKNRENPAPQSKLNKKQVEQLLKALDQHEQEVQQKMMENKARGVTKPDQDW